MQTTISLSPNRMGRETNQSHGRLLSELDYNVVRANAVAALVTNCVSKKAVEIDIFPLRFIHTHERNWLQNFFKPAAREP